MQILFYYFFYEKQKYFLNILRSITKVWNIYPGSYILNFQILTDNKEDGLFTGTSDRAKNPLLYYQYIFFWVIFFWLSIVVIKYQKISFHNVNYTYDFKIVD